MTRMRPEVREIGKNAVAKVVCYTYVEPDAARVILGVENHAAMLPSRSAAVLATELEHTTRKLGQTDERTAAWSGLDATENCTEHS